MINQVNISKRAEKSLMTVPKHIAAKFLYWKLEVEEHGIEVVRKISSYHDEPLKGKFQGAVRSIRLAQGYRAYYRTIGTTVKCILVEEVNHHDYKKFERLFGL